MVECLPTTPIVWPVFAQASFRVARYPERITAVGIRSLVDRICRAGLLTPCCKSRLNHAAKFALPGICEANGSPPCRFVLHGSNFVVGDRDRRERTSADSAKRPSVVCPARRPGRMDQH